MSVYTEVATTITDEELLKAAIAAVNATKRWPLIRSGAHDLKDWRNRPTGRIVQYSVSRDDINDEMYNEDIGWVWNPNRNAFDLIIADTDNQSFRIARKVANQVQQQYALAEYKQVARARGWTLTESRQSDGSIRVEVTTGFQRGR